MTTDVNQPLPEEYYQLLENLQELDFVLVELTLYLDTHPDDTAAINQFNDFSYKRRVLKQQMEEKYGPLQQYGNSYSNAPWEWSKGNGENVQALVAYLSTLQTIPMKRMTDVLNEVFGLGKIGRAHV